MGDGLIEIYYNGNRNVNVKANGNNCCSSSTSYDDNFTVHIGAYVGWNVSSDTLSSWTNLKYY